jgi:hypothetical protein
MSKHYGQAAMIRLAILTMATFALAACERTLTAPDHPRRPAPNSARRDEIQGDTLSCRSGYIVVDGRYVCNP